MTTSGDRRELRSTVRRDAMVTLLVVGLALAALDDITTDKSTGNFLPERIMLAACAAWLAFVAARLIREGHRILGGLSLGVLALGAAAQPGLGPSLAPMSLKYGAYGATVGALGWFVVLGGILAWRAWRVKPHGFEERTS
jgi:hypothetical protein